MKRTLLFVLLLVFKNTSAQNKTILRYENVKLEEVLFKLEEVFNSRFSYNSNLINDEKVSVEIDLSSLENSLQFIESKTRIVFKEIQFKSFIIRKNNLDEENVIICGHVLDANTKTPLSDVIISALGSDQKVFSDSKGYFRINNISKSSKIKIEKLGLSPKLIKASEFNTIFCKKIVLTQEVEVLNEVFIKNYLSKGFSKNRDGSIISLPSKIQILPGLIEPDAFQIVQLIPGIQSPDETATGLNIRGGTPDQNLVVYDGVKFYNYNHFFGLLSVFNPSIVENLNISKGGGSVKYRSHVGGYIDVRSTNKIPKRTEGGIGTNMIFSDAFLKLPVTEKLGIVASARSSFNNILQSISFDSFSDFIFQNTKITDLNNVFDQSVSKVNSSFNFKDFTFKIISEISDKSNLSFSSIYAKNELEYLALFEEINQLTNDEVIIGNLGMNLNFSTKWSNKLKTIISTSYSKYNFDYNGEEVLDAFFVFNTKKTNGVKDYNVSLDIEYNFNKKHYFLAGYDFVQNDIDYTFSNISEVIFDRDFEIVNDQNKNVIHELFTEYNFKNKRLLLSGGLRASHLSSLNSLYLQANVNTNFKLSTSFSLNLSAEKKNQFTSKILEFGTQNFGLDNEIWRASNEEIPVLENKQLSFSLIFNKNKLYIDIEAFLKETLGINALSQMIFENDEFVSIGKSNAKGVEILIKKEIKNFSSLISYSLAESTLEFKRDNSTDLKFNGSFDIRHYLNFINSIKINDLELSLGWKFKSPRPYTPANGIIEDDEYIVKIDFGEINSKRLDDYSRFDFSSTYTFKPFKNRKINAKLGFSLLNIFNTRSSLSKFHRLVLDVDNTNYKIRELNRFTLRRTPNLSFRLNF